MGEGTSSDVLVPLFLCIAASVLMFALGLWLRRTRGMLRDRRSAAVWAILTILPLFGAGAVFYARYAVDLATGAVQPGVTEDPANASGG